MCVLVCLRLRACVIFTSVGCNFCCGSSHREASEAMGNPSCADSDSTLNRRGRSRDDDPHGVRLGVCTNPSICTRFRLSASPLLCASPFLCVFPLERHGRLEPCTRPGGLDGWPPGAQRWFDWEGSRVEALGAPGRQAGLADRVYFVAHGARV